MSLRIGSLVYATQQGLGYLAKAFYDHGIITDPIIVEHAHWPTYSEWYPGAPVVQIRRLARANNQIREALKNCDLFLAFETPFDWSLFPWCQRQRIKTALMPMFECTPQELPATPDCFLCPSLLDLLYFRKEWDGDTSGTVLAESFKKHHGPGGSSSYFTPVPVDRSRIPYRQRTKAKVFVHNAGHLGLRGRNGTGDAIDAWKLVKSDAKLILRSQSKLPWDVPNSSNLDLRIGTAPYEDLWLEGDAFLFPERFNGLSLPLQEAAAAGYAIVCGNRFPMNTWLPTEPLIPVAGYSAQRVAPRCLEYAEASFSPATIAAKVDQLYDTDISHLSAAGDAWATLHSWEVLGPKYSKLLEEVVAG